MSGDVFALLTPYEDKDGLLSVVSELQRCLKNFRQYSYEFVFGIYLIEDRSISVRTNVRLCRYGKTIYQEKRS